jgi:hypothetical protein
MTLFSIRLNAYTFNMQSKKCTQMKHVASNKLSFPIVYGFYSKAVNCRSSCSRHITSKSIHLQSTFPAGH